MPETTERTAPRLLLDQRVTMRDGVELSADVYLPPTGDGPWPAILQRTPYDNTMATWVNIAVYFAQHGYVFVSQDVRGRCDSDGEWEPFVNEGPDGYDTIEWIAEQAWCDGKVGMMGGSYGGLRPVDGRSRATASPDGTGQHGGGRPLDGGAALQLRHLRRLLDRSG